MYDLLLMRMVTDEGRRRNILKNQTGISIHYQKKGWKINGKYLLIQFQGVSMLYVDDKTGNGYVEIVE